MLEVKHIKKVYHVGDIETVALKDISIEFRKKEFVAILGTSGSGKTTFLNIIGGLDRYDSGDLIIKGKHTQNFKDRDWDAYRNNSVGFVFQSYNLISHLSIVENVELGMTLSGVNGAKKKQRALEVLEQVGLKDHLHKKPNQLSGGQMQRVAIARALANDPEILLCDEPTGALDTKTSKQIMDLIKEIAVDRLVIMVTHNPELATEYATRIVNFKDGEILDDSDPYTSTDKTETFDIKHTSMSFFTALRLSFNNIKTKKGKTLLTTFASSIGIIGIAAILSLSTGFQKQIDIYQENAMAEFPIIISQTTASLDEETIRKMRNENDQDAFPNTNEVILYNPEDSQIAHQNIFTDEYMEYLQNIDPEIANSIGMTRIVNMNLVRLVDDTVKPVSMKATTSSGSGLAASMATTGLSSYPIALKEGAENYLEKNYDVISGTYPNDVTDIVLVVDKENRVNYSVLENLGFTTDDIDAIKFDDIIGTEFKIVANNDFYTTTPFGTYMPSDDYQQMYDSEDAITIRISGIVRQKQDVDIALLNTGIAYNDELVTRVIDNAMESDIVKAQEDSDRNVMTMEELTTEDKDNFLAYLGGSSKPFMLMIYPESFEFKDQVLAYLDKYNDGREIEDQIVYQDLAGTISDMTSGIMNGITLVLVAFAGISLVVSLIMIGIITYTSVMERTKEIGVLRALGARKKDITRVFDAETFLLGIFSGTMGVVIAWLLTFPINSIIYDMTELADVAQLQLSHAVILIAISTILTMLGGHIPARMAAQKDAVEALRSE